MGISVVETGVWKVILSFISPNNNFNEKVTNLLQTFPSIDITAMGGAVSGKMNILSEMCGCNV